MKFQVSAYVLAALYASAPIVEAQKLRGAQQVGGISTRTKPGLSIKRTHQGNAKNTGKGHTIGGDRAVKNLGYGYGNVGQNKRGHTLSMSQYGKKKKDSMGIRHAHYQLTYDGIPIYGHSETIHSGNNRKEYALKDSFPDDIDIDTNPTLAMDAAENIAYKHFSSKYQNDNVEILEGTELNVYQKGSVTALVYKILVSVTDPSNNMLKKRQPLVFVEAHSGFVVDSVETLYRAALVDSDKHTIDYETFQTGDSSNTILNDIHNHVGTVLDFLNTVGYDSFDDAGAVVNSFGDFPNYVNAYFDGSNFVYGNGDGVSSGPLGVLDVVAHEIGHAITQYSAGLVYQDESGALNEGCSDVLAAMIEAWVDGGVTEDTWDIGEDAWLASAALRYMDAPSTDGSSKDHYSARYVGFEDYGGVHWNSGILNHWFYLLSVGGQHHNSAFRTGVNINGIGITAAFDIWFNTWTTHLTSSSTFDGARQASLATCSDLGYTTDQCASVQNAWAEVGLGSIYVPPTESNPCGTDETLYEVDIQCDYWCIYENELTLTNLATGEKLIDVPIGGLGSYGQYTYDACVPKTDCVHLQMLDTFGDGLLEGAFIVSADGSEVYNSGDFGYGYEYESECVDSVFLSMSMHTDGWSSVDNSMTMTDVISGEVLWNAPLGSLASNSHHSWDAEVNPLGCYKIEVVDTYGDGMGYYYSYEAVTQIVFDGYMEFNGGIPDSGMTLSFGSGC